MERALNQEYKDVSLNSGFYTTGNLLKLASLMFKTSSLIIPILGFDKFADCFEIHSGVINWLTSKFCPFLRIISQSLLQVKMAIGHKSGQLAVNRNLLGFGVGKFPFLIRLPSCWESCPRAGKWLELARDSSLGSLESLTSKCITYCNWQQCTRSLGRSMPCVPTPTLITGSIQAFTSLEVVAGLWARSLQRWI